LQYQIGFLLLGCIVGLFASVIARVVQLGNEPTDYLTVRFGPNYQRIYWASAACGKAQTPAGYFTYRPYLGGVTLDSGDQCWVFKLTDMTGRIIVRGEEPQP
jgi:hypothetical protein